MAVQHREETKYAPEVHKHPHCPLNHWRAVLALLSWDQIEPDKLQYCSSQAAEFLHLKPALVSHFLKFIQHINKPVAVIFPLVNLISTVQLFTLVQFVCCLLVQIKHYIKGPIFTLSNCTASVLGIN